MYKPKLNKGTFQHRITSCTVQVIITDGQLVSIRVKPNHQNFVPNPQPSVSNKPLKSRNLNLQPLFSIIHPSTLNPKHSVPNPRPTVPNIQSSVFNPQSFFFLIQFIAARGCVTSKLYN